LATFLVGSKWLPRRLASPENTTHYKLAADCYIRRRLSDDAGLSPSCFKMEPRDSEELTSSKRKRPATEAGPFVLRSLLEDLPLSTDGDRDDVEINCVEFLGMCDGAPITSSASIGIQLTLSIQIRTSMLVPLLLRYSISSKFPQILTMHLQNPRIS